MLHPDLLRGHLSIHVREAGNADVLIWRALLSVCSVSAEEISGGGVTADTQAWYGCLLQCGCAWGRTEGAGLMQGYTVHYVCVEVNSFV